MITSADVDRWLDAWNSHDLPRILALFSDDARVHQPQNPMPLDKAGLSRFFGMLFVAYPDLHFAKAADPTISGLHAASWERATGTMKGEFLDPATGQRVQPTGKAFDIPAAMHLVYRPDRLLTEVHIYWDRLLLAQQLGLLPG